MKKQGRNNKELVEVEDWCFVCKDGGSLRLCDYKGCSKVYHPECVNRKNSFLESKKRWICDHHSCSVCCSRTEIRFSCLLCTYSLCDNCRKSSGRTEFAVLRGKDKSGLCEDCLELVRLAEDNAEFDGDGDKLDFEDQDTFESGFKDCWKILKDKEGLTFDDICEERRETIDEDEDDETILKDLALHQRKQQIFLILDDVCEERKEMVDEDEITLKDRFIRKLNKRKSDHMASCDSEEKLERVVSPIAFKNTEENVVSEDDDDDTLLRDLALHKRKKRKSVILDYEAPSDSQDNEPLLENGISEDDEDENTLEDRDHDAHTLHKKPRLVISSDLAYYSGKMFEEKEELMYPNPARNAKESCFASVAASNMKLVYLRRSLVEELMLKQPDNWERKVVGSYVRVEKDRKDYFWGYSSHQLTQVKGITRKKHGEEIQLQLLTRDVPISLLSDCDFTQEECADLRDKVENYMVRRPTVVEIEHKAIELQEDLRNDWIEREFNRLMTCIRAETNQHGWISKDLSKYVELRETLKRISEQERLLQQEPQVIAEVLDLSYL